MKLARLSFSVALAVVACAVPVCAQSISPCVAHCVSTAASQTGVGCRSGTEVSCLCGPGKFQAHLLACLQENCSPAEQRDAQRLQDELCGE